MSLNIEQVRQVARLARLQIDDTRAERYARQLSDILAMVDQLAAADTAGIEPMAHPLGMIQRLRTDVVSEPDRRAAYQASAPVAESGLYLVPKVIE